MLQYGEELEAEQFAKRTSEKLMYRVPNVLNCSSHFAVLVRHGTALLRPYATQIMDFLRDPCLQDPCNWPFRIASDLESLGWRGMLCFGLSIFKFCLYLNYCKDSVRLFAHCCP